MNSAKRKILITGSVLSSSLESIEVYKQLIDFLKDNEYDVSSPLDTMKFEGTDEERYIRAVKLVESADVMIAEASTPSTGQGMEIMHALNFHIPILVIAKEGSKVSGLLKGCKDIKIVYYSDILKIKETIIQFIKSKNS